MSPAARTSGRPAATALLLLGLVLCASLLGPALAKDPKCEAARSTLTNNPELKNFRDCAGQKPITASCCRKLLPFAQYYDCLSDPDYKKEADAFLKGVSSVDEVQSECLA
ncbi:hypothetical protein CHLRE_07g325200v5 [Chlamydomonas reinhardtii]|uniref:Uncharacterized protein n=1 Tax=Chlamydomonas reinhardtii TaxID=3055 RepID=A8I7M4_CHLRE|nr:uncharacterized protein CHLRE_07g325200v5 [Chlamydomonas reinhardtii]PNW80620.1 hypothetical protein CHLRE_07g325200v5 [Chlamydomonas reinhardtii]|eukprot:XP_001701071.1 predicted protein [Chlamydomonas reinhardtii]